MAEVKVGATNSNISLGSYRGTGNYQGIEFKATGDIKNTDWDSHFLKQISCTISNSGIKRLNIFKINWCSNNKILELHIASGTAAIMQNENFIKSYSNTKKELDLDPKDTRNKNINIKFIVYAYSNTNKDDDTILKCNKTSGKVPVYTINVSKNNVEIDPTPDTHNGNVLVGKN